MSWLTQTLPKLPKNNLRRQTLWWDGALVVSGLLLVAITYHNYQFFEPLSGRVVPASLPQAEADRRIEAAKSYLNSHPDDMNAQAQLAVAYYQKGPEYYADGMNALDKARALGATIEALFFYAGVMEESLGLSDYALNDLTKYLRHYPQDYETLVRIANLNFRLHKLDEALAYYQKALEQSPKDPTVWFNYAVASKEKGLLDQALASLERVQKLAGHYPEGGFYQEGEIWRLKGLEEKAITSFQQELVARPDYLPALEALEAALKRKGDLKEARSLRSKIAELKRPRPS